MLDNGLLWLNKDGMVISINYQSEDEKLERLRIIESDRSGLHVSLQEYLEPVLGWETKDYRIRIDNLGDNQYRYSSWKIRDSKKSIPQLIIENGSFTADGSGGNHYYIFQKGSYKYLCYRAVITEDQSKANMLYVYKNNKLILQQVVTNNS